MTYFNNHCPYVELWRRCHAQPVQMSSFAQPHVAPRHSTPIIGTSVAFCQLFGAQAAQ